MARPAVARFNPESREILARFPGQHCATCGAEFVPGEDLMKVDPTRVGPKGGKVYVHAAACGRSSARRNPEHAEAASIQLDQQRALAALRQHYRMR